MPRTTKLPYYADETLELEGIRLLSIDYSAEPGTTIKCIYNTQENIPDDYLHYYKVTAEGTEYFIRIDPFRLEKYADILFLLRKIVANISTAYSIYNFMCTHFKRSITNRHLLNDVSENLVEFKALEVPNTDINFVQVSDTMLIINQKYSFKGSAEVNEIQVFIDGLSVLRYRIAGVSSETKLTKENPGEKHMYYFDISYNTPSGMSKDIGAAIDKFYTEDTRIWAAKCGFYELNEIYIRSNDKDESHKFLITYLNKERNKAAATA